MRILVLSDLHLDKPRGELKRFDLEDAKTAIASLQNYTAGIDAVILAGDIFNAVRVDSVPFHLLHNLDEVLKDIPKKYVIRGNHDRARFSILEETYGYTALKPDEVIPISDTLTISGCDYTDRETHKEYLRSADSDILVCHFPMSPFSSFGDSNLSVNDCPENKIVIVGDTHKPGVYAKDGRCVISPGCLFPADRTELLSKHAGSGFILTVDKNNGELSAVLSQISIETRFGADLSALKTRDELVLGLKSIELKEAFPANLRPVVYVDSSLLDTESSVFELIAAPKTVETSSGITADFSGLDGEGVDSRIRRILSTLYEGRDDRDELLEFTVDILSTDDPASLISSYVRR